MAGGVTLQISLAPPDLPHAVHVLPHQLRVWQAQVTEILFTLDTVRPAGGRFAAAWDAREQEMAELLDGLTSVHAAARIGPVDASPQATSAVSQRFFGIDRIPMKDSRGGPLYSYFYGLHDAANDLVLHVDSDMMFGGASQTWIAEAIALCDSDADALFVGPLPGPPRDDGALVGQPQAVTVASRPHAFRFPTMSSRVFVVDRRRLRERVGHLRLQPPILLRSRIKARIKSNPSVAMPEQILSIAMHRRGLHRVDFLGEQPGMWSLHPPFRSDAFYRRLPELIAQIESGNLPPEQHGNYDLVDQVFDFSDVRAKLRRSPLRR
jgi:hypothetical protein